MTEHPLGNKIAIDAEEYVALKHLRDNVHEELRIKLAALELRQKELLETNSKQLSFVNSVSLEAGHLRTTNELLTKHVTALSANQDAVAATVRITNLDKTIAELQMRLRQAEGTQLFQNNQRLLEENKKLRAQLKAEGPVVVAVTPPPVYTPLTPAQLITQSAEFAAKHRGSK